MGNLSLHTVDPIRLLDIDSSINPRNVQSSESYQRKVHTGGKQQQQRNHHSAVDFQSAIIANPRKHFSKCLNSLCWQI